VVLVNAQHVKNVPGRKTDVVDCQWLQELHSVGLLRGSFRPAAAIAVLRAYLRHRETLVQSAATHVQRMQKALVQMNLRLGVVISDITGVTRLRILRAFVAVRAGLRLGFPMQFPLVQFSLDNFLPWQWPRVGGTWRMPR